MIEELKEVYQVIVVTDGFDSYHNNSIKTFKSLEKAEQLKQKLSDKQLIIKQNSPEFPNDDNPKYEDNYLDENGLYEQDYKKYLEYWNKEENQIFKDFVRIEINTIEIE